MVAGPSIPNDGASASGAAGAATSVPLPSGAGPAQAAAISGAPNATTTSAATPAAPPVASDVEQIVSVVQRVLGSGAPGRLPSLMQAVGQGNEYTAGDHGAGSQIGSAYSAQRDIYVSINGAAQLGGAAPLTKSADAFGGDLTAWLDTGKVSDIDLNRVIAIAALHGSTAATISASARQLHGMFLAGRLGDANDPAPPIETTGAMLLRLGAMRVRPSAGESGVVTREAVLFHDADWRAKVLGAAWSDVEGCAARLSSWLIEIAQDAPFELRTVLCETIAICYQNDPQGAFSALILPLARGAVAQRWVAANALGIAAADGDVRPSVVEHLTNAANFRYGKSGAIVAALSIGGTFGKDNPGPAAKLLVSLTQSWRSMDSALGVAIEGIILLAREDAAAGKAIIDVLAGWPHWKDVAITPADIARETADIQLVVEGPPVVESAQDAVRYLRDRVKPADRDNQGRAKYLNAAELLAIVAVTILDPHEIETGDDEKAAGDKKQSATLIAAGKDDKLAESGAQLLVRLLAFQPSRQMAWSIMREGLSWRGADKAKGVVAVLKSFSAIASAYEQEQFRRHLTRWQHQPEIRKTLETFTATRN